MRPSAVRPTATRRFDSPEQEAFLNLWRTYDRLRALEDELFGRHGLTAQQYNALRLLRACHPESLPTLELAARLVSRAPDITRLLDKLEQRALVARDRLPENRRVVRVSITDAGRAPPASTRRSRRCSSTSGAPTTGCAPWRTSCSPASS